MDNCPKPTQGLTTQSLRWSIEHINPSQIPAILKDWTIDSPSPGSPFGTNSVVSLVGWALGSNAAIQSALHLVLRSEYATCSYPLTRSRPDVIKNKLVNLEAGEDFLRCGFDVPISLSEACSGIELGFEYDGFIKPAANLILS